MHRKLSVLMPVYNEARTLGTIIERVLSAPVDLEIELIAVDDASSDDSPAILRTLASGDDRIRIVTHPTNAGKGQAIRTAVGHLTGDIAIIQDADLEYDPSDWPRVLQPILDGRADAVYGSRFTASEEHRVLPFWHTLGNRTLTTISNMVTNLDLTDMETCTKAIRADVLRELRLTSDRFGIEPEITARLAAWGARLYEVPVSYHGRTYAEGKNIGWWDSITTLGQIFRFRVLDTRPTDEGSTTTRLSQGRAPRFRRWVRDEFGTTLGDRVLEVEAGPGHVTTHLLDRRRLVCVDAAGVSVESLRRRYGHLANFEVRHHDLGEADLPDDLVDGFDTVVLFDVLQRAAEPKQVLSRAAAGLAAGGHALVLVPADPSLFGPTDEAAGHRQRFDRQSLEAVIASAGLELVSMRSFNRLGRLAWRIHHALGAGPISAASARSFDLLVPLARRIDAMSSAAGLSWLAVARSP